MSGEFDSGGKGNGSKAKKGGGFWDGVRSLGSAVVEGFLGGSSAPSVGRRDPVAARDRPAAARQIHRSLKAWRDKEPDASPADDEAKAPEDASAAKEEEATTPDAVEAGPEATSNQGDGASEQEGAVEQAEETDGAATQAEEEPAEIATKPVSVAAKLKGIHCKVFLAGKDSLRGPKKEQMGSGPEVGAMKVGNAAQAGIKRPPQHHVFPQEQAAWFTERGVDVHQFCVTIEESHHQAIHSKAPGKSKEAEEAKKWEWNNAIMKVLKDAETARKRKLTLKDMLPLVQGLMPQYGLKGPFEAYKGGK